MKKLLYIILLLPLWVNAQTNGTIQKTSATGTIRGSFGSLGLDTLPRVTGALVDGYILKYHAATNKWYASPDASGSLYIQNQHASKQTASAWVDSLQAQKFRSGTAPFYNKANFVVKQAITNHAFYGYIDDSDIVWNTDSVRGHASYLSSIDLSGTGTGDHHHAFQASDNYTGSDSLVNMSAFLSGQGHTGTGVLMNAKAFDGTTDISGSGYIGNNYGLFLGNRTRGTLSNYQIFTQGTAPSLFGGRITLQEGLYLTGGSINLSGINAAKIIGGGVTTAIRNDVDGLDMLSFNNSTTNATFNGTVTLADEVYSSSWNGKLEAPTKNAIWDAGFLTSASGVTSITGTTNQITASASTGAVTLGLPSTITGLTSVSSTGFTGALTGNASTATALQTARTIGTLTGDITSAGSAFDGTANNTNATTLATVNANVGSFGTATQSPTLTVNGKGLITAVSNTTITPAVGSITGLGTGVGTALAVNTGSAGSVVVNGGDLGTPSSGVATNLTGTASGLTAGNVTTNANLTGAITSSGNATSLGHSLRLTYRLH